jgi:hypothetical protein
MSASPSDCLKAGDNHPLLKGIDLHSTVALSLGLIISTVTDTDERLWHAFETDFRNAF